MNESVTTANKLKVLNLLQERDEERKKSIDQRKQLRNTQNAEHEQSNYFLKEFNDKHTAVIETIAEIETREFSNKDLANKFDYILKEVDLLQKYVSDSTLFLSDYHVRKCQEMLHELTVQTKVAEDKFLPKKKFGFKNKKKVTTTDEVDAKAVVIQPPLRTIPIDIEFCGFQSMSDQVLTLERETIHQKDVTLLNLHNCTIFLLGSPSTIHVDKLTKCTVLTGPVSTSIFIEQCVDSQFVIACQQLRLHSSKRCNIYLHVTSRAIIEDSSQIQFAPYSFQYTSIEDDFRAANLDIAVNNWQCVDDFNWLAFEKQSPNWNVLSTELRADWKTFLKEKHAL